MNTKKKLFVVWYRKRRIRTGVVVKDGEEMCQKFKCNVREEARRVVVFNCLLDMLTRSVKIGYFTEQGG